MSSGTQVLRTISLQSPQTAGQRKWEKKLQLDILDIYVIFILIFIYTSNYFRLGLVTIPLQNAKVSSVKPGDSVMTKTIQLTSAQMVNTNILCINVT